jgi:hypothetical protein
MPENYQFEAALARNWRARPSRSPGGASRAALFVRVQLYVIDQGPPGKKVFGGTHALPGNFHLSHNAWVVARSNAGSFCLDITTANTSDDAGGNPLSAPIVCNIKRQAEQDKPEKPLA